MHTFDETHATIQQIQHVVLEFFRSLSQVPPDRELELTVVLCYDNEPMKFVHAPRYCP